MTSDNQILFLGDVYLDTQYKTPPINTPLVFNLEAPLTNHNRPVTDKIVLKSSSDFLKKTFNPLPIAVCLANNHIMDYGDKGYLDTITFLNENRIRYFGAGSPGKNYNNPLILDINGYKVGLLGYCYNEYFDQIDNTISLEHGPAPLNMKLIVNDINMLKKTSDRIVVNLHWGKLYSNYPRKAEIIMARTIIDSGADVIVGHHAHTLQPIEIYKNRLIAYNIGNFIFPDLNLPTHYTKAGHPTRRRVKKQRIWNNSSVGILMNMFDLSYKIECFIKKKHAVKHSRTLFHKYLNININAIYDNIDTLAFRSCNYKKAFERIANYLNHPGIPSKTGSKDIINIIKSTLKGNGI